MKILFICKYNRFRSRVAEAYFNKINKNKNIKSASAGLIMGSSVNDFQKNTVRKFGLDISGRPKPLSSKLLKDQDMIIIVADDVPKEIFKSFKAKIIVWRIPDAKVNKEDVIVKIVKPILNKVKKLKENLKGIK